MATTTPRLLQTHEFYVLKYKGIVIYCRIVTDSLVDKKLCQWESETELEGIDKTELQSILSRLFSVGIDNVKQKVLQLKEKKHD